MPNADVRDALNIMYSPCADLQGALLPWHATQRAFWLLAVTLVQLAWHQVEPRDLPLHRRPTYKCFLQRLERALSQSNSRVQQQQHLLPGQLLICCCLLGDTACLVFSAQHLLRTAGCLTAGRICTCGAVNI